MPQYRVTLRNGNKFTIDANSPDEAKRNIRAMLKSLAKHATTPEARAAYAEQSAMLDMKAERKV